MSTFLNYLIEANLTLIICYAVYFLVLRHETDFRMMRLFLLVSLFSALVVPLVQIDIGQDQSALSIGRVIPTYWLPEVNLGDTINNPETTITHSGWLYALGIYGAGVFIFGCLFMYESGRLWHMIKHARTYPYGNLRVVESNEDHPTFSFFNFIFIGRAHQLSAEEKHQVILHERVHAHQWHSLDILLLNALKILFWFNPLIYQYKKTFIQLHEFEADARAAEHTDVNKYCNLLARVALQSAGFRLANHFHNSLTIKRIEMMKTIKRSVHRWKVVALAVVLPLIMFMIACNDQVESDLNEIAKESSHALIVPPDVQARFDQLKAENPDKHYALIEIDEDANEKIMDIQNKYGLPASVEVFKTKGSDGKSGFVIVEMNTQTKNISESSKTDGVYTVVEEQPSFPGGYDAMVEYMKANIRYPADARAEGKEGTAYVSFIVQADGTITDVKTVRGVSASIDAEATRVVQNFPKWVPGKQSGRAVAVRFVMPVKFALLGQ